MSRKVALLIGVSEYGEGIPSLSAPLNDIAAMKRVLENTHMGGFEVKTLINPDLVAMQKAVEQIFANCHKDDLVLLFFSGHGITDDNNRLYIATKGTAKDFYKATSVPASFIQDVSLESYAKRQVIVLDCCYSGAFAEGWQAKSMGIDLEKELGAEGRVVLTSSSAIQKSFQQEGEELSLYTQYFIEGIETGAADKEGNGKIYAHELHDYAKGKVQEAKPKQKPEIIIDKEGFNILLSQAPVNDPELDFRKLAEKYATEGQITVAGNYILQVKRQELGITEEKADEIVNEVLAPYRKRIENIKLYKQVFAEAVEKNHPLNERLLNELQDLQDVLGLEDNDIAQVKEKILVEKKAEHQLQQNTLQQEQEEYENKLQQYKQEFLKAVEQEYPLSENTRNEINVLQQSLRLRTEHIRRIEQPILAAKYQEKLEEEERQKQKKQKVERAKQLELQKQREQEESQQQRQERLKQKEEERLEQQQKENIASPPPIRQTGILSKKKTRRNVLLGSTALGIVLIFSGFLLKINPVNNPTKETNSDPDQTSSEPALISKDTKVNYTKLSNLLLAGKWREADRETTRAMLQAVGRKEKWLRAEDINKFSCEDLRIIDQLWLKSSQGKFGFSVQKDIYQNLVAEPSKSRESELGQNLFSGLNGNGDELELKQIIIRENFLEKVGWTGISWVRGEGTTIEYDGLFSADSLLDAPKGQLPTVTGTIESQRQHSKVLLWEPNLATIVGSIQLQQLQKNNEVPLGKLNFEGGISYFFGEIEFFFSRVANCNL